MKLCSSKTIFRCKLTSPNSYSIANSVPLKNNNIAVDAIPVNIIQIDSKLTLSAFFPHIVSIPFHPFMIMWKQWIPGTENEYKQLHSLSNIPNHKATTKINNIYCHGWIWIKYTFRRILSIIYPSWSTTSTWIESRLRKHEQDALP